MAKRVLCVGNAVVDHIFSMPTLPRGDGKFFADTMQREVGGIAAVAALAVRALGGDAALLAATGGDANDTFLRRELHAAGVDTSPSPAPRRRLTALSAVCVDAEGRRMIINHTPPPPRSVKLPPLAAFDAVLADLRWPAMTWKALRTARRQDIPAVLDADAIPTADVAADDFMRRAAAAATHIIFSRPGLRRLFAGAPAAALKQAAAIAPAADVAVTCGAAGVYYWSRQDGRAHHLPAARVKVNNTLGAGDVFHAAAALALAEGRSFVAALRFAAAAATAKCLLSSGKFPNRQDAEKAAALS